MTIILTSEGSLSGSISHLMTDFVREKPATTEIMNNPDNNKDDKVQRLEIMKAFYTFQESGQWFSDDQEGRILHNQIIKMVS